MSAVVPVVPHGRETRLWRQGRRGGTCEDRTFSEVSTRIPPSIGSIDIHIPPPLLAEIDVAQRAIARLDEVHGAHVTSLSTLLLRAESVASSKIEHVEASLDDYARALYGVRSNASAVSMVASTRALHDLIESVADGTKVSLRSILNAHAILMTDDRSEQSYAGKVRDLQNWIGGSDHSPRGALYVPPPPEYVSGFLGDSIDFTNRDDLNALTQAAVPHAQFESVHPFTDGNGRIGRALINTVLRRRGVTTRIAVPLAAALAARRDDYFDSLTAYRNGDARQIITALARSAQITAEESRTTADRLTQLPGGPARSSMNSTTSAIGSDPGPDANWPTDGRHRCLPAGTLAAESSTAVDCLLRPTAAALTFRWELSTEGLTGRAGWSSIWASV